MTSAISKNKKLVPDSVIADIAAYADRYQVKSELAWENAHYCLIDSLGCCLEALTSPECTKLLGPLVPGIVVPNGARVPGTSFMLDPVQAAFDIGTMVRWLDFNDTLYGETLIHPSDAFGATLAVADWSSRSRLARGKPPLSVRDVLEATIKAYEIQGALAMENSFTKNIRIDYVVLVKIACAAVITKLLGGTRAEITSAVSNAWIDGQALITYRRKQTTGSRKSWAGGDAASRGVWLALLALRGEMGYPTALTARKWGFYDVMCKGKPFEFQRPYGTSIMENVQFKIECPAAFHTQTAVEAALSLHPLVKNRIDDIAQIELWTHAYSLSYLSRTGPLQNFADRDHCLQYIVAIGMIFGKIVAHDYEDDVASDKRIDLLRSKMVVHEDVSFTRGFNNSKQRSNANAIQVHFKDGTQTERVKVEYPIGHPRRRGEGVPLLVDKFKKSVAGRYAEKQQRAIIDICLDRKRLYALPINELLDLMAV